MRKILIKKEILKTFYCDKSYSGRDIAKIYQCDSSVIFRRLREYKIPLKLLKQEIIIPEKKLAGLYLKKKLSTYKIARIYNCDPKTIYKKLKDYKIPTRPLKIIKISKNKLDDLYFKKRLSLKKISKLYRCNQVAIFKKMKRYDMNLRTPWETNIKYPRYNFSDDKIEKAYLLGFRAGDLGVRKTSKKTGTILVGCNSTKPAQIKLINQLFRNYGPVWIGKKNYLGVRSIDTSLNRSFNFLLPKKDKVASWILANKKYFAAYTAGYTDAEGSIGIYRNRAKFRLGSYDIGILKAINSLFLKRGFKALLTLETKAGFRDKRGVIHRGNFWRITINEKASLLFLFNLIGPYLKHSDRIRAMKKAINNIHKRNKKFNRLKKK